jgi:manganese/iron transport system permease protein
VNLLIEPLTQPFMQRALIATIVVGLVAAVVGTFVVHKGLAFIGDALAHASFAGIALALLLNGNIYLGAGIAALGTAGAIGFLSQKGRVSSDTVIGVLFAGMFSLGVVFMSRVRTFATDALGYVFGNVLGVGYEDLALIAVAGLIVVALVVIFYKELLFSAFDPVMARAVGVPVAAMQYLLLALIAVTVVVSMQAIGIVLVVAMLVTPAATASQLSQRFPRIMAIAAGLSVAASVLGLYASYYGDVPSGAAIVLVNTLFFLAVLVAGPRAGWRRPKLEAAS